MYTLDRHEWSFSLSTIWAKDNSLLRKFMRFRSFQIIQMKVIQIIWKQLRISFLWELGKRKQINYKRRKTYLRRTRRPSIERFLLFQLYNLLPPLSNNGCQKYNGREFPPKPWMNIWFLYQTKTSLIRKAQKIH